MAERRTRTAAEKASEALDTHMRKIKRIDDAIAHQKEVLANYEAQRKELEPRLAFLLADPDLPEDRRPTPESTTSEAAEA